MTRRAMTLLETLAAIGLLGILAGASLGWVTASQRTLTESVASTTWVRAANATLAMLHDDLVAGDTSNDSVITIEPGPNTAGSAIESIAFSTRSGRNGACVVVYDFNDLTSQLTRSVNGRKRLLLGSALIIEIEMISSPMDPDSPPAELIARLTSTLGEQVERRIRLGSREIKP